MSILVTGGAGFIGKAAVRRLLKTEDRVVVMDKKPLDLDRVESVGGDIRVFSDVMKVVDEYKIKKIIHIAAALTKPSEEYPYAAVHTNVLGTANILECARLTGIKRVVLCSTISTYSAQESYGDRPVKEDEVAMNPPFLYGATKLFGEYMASTFEKKYGLEIPALRIAAVYGMGTEAKAMIAWSSKMITAAVRGGSVTLPLRSDQWFSFIYVDDVAELLVRLCLAEKLKYRVYNSGGHLSTTGKLKELIKKYYPDAKIEFDENTPWWRDAYKFDTTRVVQEFNFQLRDPESGLLDMMNQERSSMGLSPLKRIP